MKNVSQILKNRRHVVFLDFEGTQFSHEMIAIGAIKTTIDAKGNIVKYYPGFKEFVLAKNSIGKVVTKLTGITQKTLDEKGIPFKDAMKKFKSYCGLSYKKSIFVTFGNHDMRILSQSLINSSDAKREDLDVIFKNHIDFSALLFEFIRDSKNNPYSLHNYLKALQVEDDGNEHDPLYDAINLAHLWQGFLTKKDLVMENYMDLLSRSTHFPQPVTKAIKKLLANEVVTPEEFKENTRKYIDDKIS